MESFVMKISFHSQANKTNLNMKSFALSLTFIMRFKTMTMDVSLARSLAMGIEP